MSVTDALGVAWEGAGAQTTPPGTIMPTVPYSPIWGVLAAALIVGVVLYYGLTWLLTRPRPEAPPPAAAPTPVRSVPELQGVYLHEIDSILQRHAAGELSPRRAHAALSVTVREFLSEATGVPADKMTLTDLRQTPYVGATYAVAEYYPIVFGAQEAQSVEHGAHAARQVIALWQ
ncbi:hypothetical protein GCM10011490_05990 [Pseudoclavibacter endophyticus]|uniref:Uncharacterized protein n=1 Tax=Pseudoclavibacter endophyticus TaxID=1778590 RepID=A0A6H9WT95_9MICO|nr:hypothetical protein [Pseudoclavibacter endophyticus]KAB1649905.1 hypothetical protein F8O04_06685 [Pseudoclavibacter endophyticus]GGA58828.1 hypothetical protein GCM10011490_05990 [Pseudoclavibacter endophyticus]